VRRRVHHLARLPYARLACLLLAAVQLMPLPEEPEDHPGHLLGVALIGPDPWSQRPPLEGGILMQHDQKQLHQIARDNPCYMFTVEEIALVCNVSRDVVSKARGADDSPFFLNKCRPEWFLEWMREHPGFQLTKDSPPPSGVSMNGSASERPSKTARPKKPFPRPLAVRKSQTA
jgi:hypothetical protein